MRSRFTPRLGAVVALTLVTVLTAAACAPDAPRPTTSTTPTSSTIPGNQPPVAVAANTPDPLGYFGLPVSFSSAGSTDDGGIVGYSWDFGDGTAPSTSPNPTHTYTQPGSYTATLTVTDGSALTGSATTTVTQATPAAEVEVVPNPVTIVGATGTANVRVWWKNQAPSTLIFVDVCRKSIADPTFKVALDCSQLTGLTPNGTASGAGTTSLGVFRGPDPAEEPWGCFAASDVAPPGVQKNTTCYVRVTNNVVSNKDSSREAAFTITAG